jgi:hypothetical protein
VHADVRGFRNWDDPRDRPVSGRRARTGRPQGSLLHRGVRVSDRWRYRCAAVRSTVAAESIADRRRDDFNPSRSSDVLMHDESEGATQTEHARWQAMSGDPRGRACRRTRCANRATKRGRPHSRQMLDDAGCGNLQGYHFGRCFNPFRLAERLVPLASCCGSMTFESCLPCAVRADSSSFGSSPGHSNVYRSRRYRWRKYHFCGVR